MSNVNFDILINLPVQVRPQFLLYCFNLEIFLDTVNSVNFFADGH